MSYPWPGIREDLYIGGVVWAKPPQEVVPTWLDAKESTRARTGKLYVDFLQPEAGWPVVTRKLSLTLSWPTMTPADIRAANGILARGTQALDVCTWVEISEAFWFAAGLSFAGSLKRRNALSVVSPLPPLAATRHAVSAVRGDGSALSVTLGTADADGITPWTASGTSTGEYVTISYSPVYYMTPAEGQEAFPQAHEQSQTLRLEEL